MNPALTRRASGWVAAAAVLLLAACSPSSPSQPSRTTLTSQDAAGFEHVHGVQVDPTDRTVLVATHSGVWLVPDPYQDGPRTARLAGDGRQDTMGMTVSDDGTVYASGHPAPGEQTDLAEPNLGLIRSTDRAVTWGRVSSAGEVDFHALTTATTADGVLHIVGLDSATSRLLISDDGGTTWTAGAAVEARSVLIMRDDPDEIVVTTPLGLQLSHDGGQTFTTVRDAPTLVFVEAGLGAELVGIDPTGVVWTGAPGLDEWTRHGLVPSPVQAMTYVPDDGPGRQPWILVATDAGLFTSIDLGTSWEPALDQVTE